MNVVADGVCGPKSVNAARDQEIFRCNALKEFLRIIEKFARLFAHLWVVEDRRVTATQFPRMTPLLFFLYLFFPSFLLLNLPYPTSKNGDQSMYAIRSLTATAIFRGAHAAGVPISAAGRDVSFPGYHTHG